MPIVQDALGRHWFQCVGCGRRVRHIYLDEVRCRVCLRLDYCSRHLHRSTPSVHRIMRWRRQLGIDPHPFAPIAKRKRHHLRYHRIVARILIEEEVLRGYLRKVSRDLDRRARLRGLRCETLTFRADSRVPMFRAYLLNETHAQKARAATGRHEKWGAKNQRASGGDRFRTPMADV